MANFFSILNSILKQDEYAQTNYGDLITESSKEDRLKRNMTADEIAYFDEIKKNNRERIYENCGNNIHNDYNIDKPKENIMISGIGQVTQMM